MANPSISTNGRFSSQQLTNFGVQRTVTIKNGVPTNNFKYNTGSVTFPSAGSYLQSALGFGVVGNFSPPAFDSTKCYFLSRGVGTLYADTMTALAIDMAAQLGITPQALLEQSEVDSLLFFSDNAYISMNNLRDPGNQVGVVTTVDNRFSLQASQIRS